MSVVATDANCQPGRGRRHAADAASRAGRLHTNHRWKVLGIGVAANASFSATFAGIPATAVFLRSGYHLSNGNLGLVLGLLGLGVALSELPWGLLTDRWGDRGVLLTGLGATAAWLLLMALFIVPSMAYVPGVAMLAACLLVTGLLGGSVNGSSGRAIMAWFHEGERGFAMSIRQTAVPLGGGLGALVLPSLASAHGFALVFGLLAALNAVSALFAWRWLHQPPEIDLCRQHCHGQAGRSGAAAQCRGLAPRHRHRPALFPAGGGAHLCLRLPARFRRHGHAGDQRQPCRGPDRRHGDARLERPLHRPPWQSPLVPAPLQRVERCLPSRRLACWSWRRPPCRARMPR